MCYKDRVEGLCSWGGLQFYPARLGYRYHIAIISATFHKHYPNCPKLVIIFGVYLNNVDLKDPRGF